MSATLAILVLASGVLAVHLATVLLALRRLRPHQGTAGVIGTPRVTLLRPVCGLDPFDAETLTSSFRQDYPGFEVIFCAQRPDDPVIALIERLIAAHPQVPARLMIGDDPVSRNPKLNNVWKGWHAARHDWICMTDSNLLLPPDYLATVVSAWREGTGLVSSPAVGIRPQGWGGHLECAVLNGNQARWQLAADSLGDGFAQGKTLFFNRPLLERAGGLRALGRLIAEDAAATHVVRGLGLKVRLTPMPFAQPVGRRSLRQVWDRQLRWSRVRRDGFPGLFALEGLNSALPLALVLAGLGNLGVALAFLALWYAAEWHLTRRAGWPATWRDALALPLRDAMLPALWLATWRRRGFTWRGTPDGRGTGPPMTATAELLGLVRSHGTLILAPLAVLEGPIVSIVAGYLASRGLLLLKAVIPVVILADLVGDVALYALGRWGRRFLPPRPSLARMARRLRADGTRILVVGKLTHTAGFAVLIAAGIARMPLARFLVVNLLATIPKSLFFLALGWIFGAAWAQEGGPWVYVAALTTLVLFALFLWQPWRRR